MSRYDPFGPWPVLCDEGFVQGTDGCLDGLWDIVHNDERIPHCLLSQLSLEMALAPRTFRARLRSQLTLYSTLLGRHLG